MGAKGIKGILLSKRFAGTLAFLVPALALCAIFAWVGIWPFGAASALTGDLGGIYTPVMAALRRALLAGDGLLYSFSKSLGGEILTSYATSGDLLFLPLYLLVPTAHLPDMLTFVYILKIGLTSWFAWLWLANRPVASPWWALAAACAYALSSYHMAFLQNTMWLNVAMLAPLVLLCIERFAALRWRLAYCGLLALALFANFYTGYMLCIFSALYFVYDLLAQSRAPGLIAALPRLGRFAGYSLLAAGLVAALLLQVVGAAGQAKGGLFALDAGFGRNFCLFSLPEVLLAGSFRQGYLSGWLPFVYCGQLAMLGAALYFFNRLIPRRSKILAGCVLAVFFLSFWLELPNVIWHGFKHPIWFSFRYSFLCILFLCMLAADNLARHKGVPLWACAAVGGAWLCLVGYASLRSRETGLVRVGVTVAAALLVLLALALRKAGLRRLVAVFAVAELLLNGVWTQNELEFKDRVLYIEQAEAMEAMAAQTETGYRAENEWFYTLNDPLLYGFSGFSYFNSVQDNATLETLQAFGFLDSSSTEHGTGSGGIPSANRLLALRYRMAREGDGEPPGNYTEIFLTGAYALYGDEEALPMVFAASGAVAALQLGENPVENLNAAYTALTGLATPILTDAGGYVLELDNLAVNEEESGPGATMYVVQDPAEGAAVVLRYTMPRDGTLVLTMQSLDHAAVHLSVNGRALGYYGVTGYGGLRDCGSYAAGDEVEIRLGVGAGQSLQSTPVLYLEDAEALAAHLDALQAGLPQNLVMGQGSVSATVLAEEGDVLFTTIPYAQGWRASVNGERVEPVAVDGKLMAVSLEAGQNLVVLEYSPASLGLGIGISLASLAALCAIAIYGLLRRRKGFANTPAGKVH